MKAMELQLGGRVLLHGSSCVNVVVDLPCCMPRFDFIWRTSMCVIVHYVPR